MTHKSTAFAIVFAVLLATAPAMGSSAPARVSPAGQDAVGWTSYDVPEDVIRHENASHPGLFVTVDTAADLDTLATWTEQSSERAIQTWYNQSNTVLLSAPMSHVAHPPVSLSNVWSTQTTLVDLSYVAGWSFNREVRLPDSVGTLAPEDEWTDPRGSDAVELATDGEFSAKSMAWESDAEPGTMDDVRPVVGADSVSADGTGVKLAVIDSGVNINNGTYYGNGTAGSDMRVADAYDFVEGAGANMSVSRANLSNELDVVADPNGHGSWVSSATLNAQSGIAPNATLLAYRALNADGEGSSEQIRSAVARADAHGADIIVMSLGTPIYSDALADELTRVLSEDGNVTGVFVATGNSYLSTRYLSSPSDVEGVIGVTATNIAPPADAQKAYFANIGPDTGADGSDGRTHGELPDTAAPGMVISTQVITSSGAVRSEELSGTSMATPIAAGVGALLLDAEPGMVGEPATFRNRLVNSGAHTPHLGVTESRGGMVNASRAINQNWKQSAPDRELLTNSDGRDTANRWLTGNVGTKLAKFSEWWRSAT